MRRIDAVNRPKLLLFGTIFVAAFLIVFNLIWFISKVSAEAVPSIHLNSGYVSFENGEEGAWRVTKTAELTSLNTATLSIDIETIMKGSGTDKDVVIVMDTSGSMSDDGKMAAFKESGGELAEQLLNDEGNRMALIEFNSTARLVTDFTDKGWVIRNALNSREAVGGTNYYSAIVALEDFFSNYTFTDDRSPVVLFFTDGAPVEDSPAEIAEYRYFKQLYPQVQVQGIQYEMGDTLNPAIASVSDNQFIAKKSNLTDVMFEAVSDGYYYDEFVVDDNIEINYFMLDSYSTTLGVVNYDSTNGKISWDLSNFLRSGGKATMTMKLSLTQACYDSSTSYCNTNRRMGVRTKLQGVSDEQRSTTDSPTLRLRYNLSYDLNSPSDCTASGTVPSAADVLVYSTQEFPDQWPTCEGYKFNGWSLSASGMRLSDDYFSMPAEDMTVMALWSKPTIEKKMDGEVYVLQHATLRHDLGSVVASIAGSTNKVKTATVVDYTPEDYTPDDSNRLSDVNSLLPINGWFESDSGTLYMYTPADIIDLPENSNQLFQGWSKMTDISFMEDFDASHVTTTQQMFYDVGSVADWSPISGWDVSNVKTMYRMFVGTKLTSLEFLSEWKTTSLEDMSNMFYGTPITSADGLENWDVSHVKNMQSLFGSTWFSSYCRNLVDISALAGWDTSSVENMSEMFVNTAIKDVSSLAGWEVGNVTTLAGMFRGTSGIAFAPLAGWDVSSVTNMRQLFYSTKDMDYRGIEDWVTGNVTTMEAMFERATVSSTAGLDNWDVSSVTTMESMFAYAKGPVGLGGLSGWQTSSLTNMISMFYDATLYDVSPLAGWDVSHVTSLSATFANSGLADITGLSGWTTSSLTSLRSAFYGDPLQSLEPLADWDVDLVTDMHYTFGANSSTSLTSLHGLENWVTSSLKYLDGTFYQIKYLVNIDAIENWDVDLVTTMESMFQNDTNVTSIAKLHLWKTTSLKSLSAAFAGMTLLVDISGLGGLNWDVSSVTNMSSMFKEDTSLSNLAGISDWTTTSLRTISSFLYLCSSITDISALSDWDVSNVDDMDDAFNSTNFSDTTPLGGWVTTSLKEMQHTFANSAVSNLSGIGSWDVSKVTTFWDCFGGASHVTSLAALSSWTPSAATTMKEMFAGTAVTDLSGLESWLFPKVTSMTYMFCRCTQLTDISAIAGWTMGGVRYISYMFAYDAAITNLTVLNNWNTESISEKNNTFYNIPDSVERPEWY